MSYQVLARRFRPKTFSELIGQDQVSTTLINALKASRMPHALLFTGPRGVGKTSAARILAKSLRCPNAKEFAPCGKCDECQAIAAGTAVDVIEIDGASNNSVENVRELRETVGYMPSTGKYKIYIIDEVHMLSTSAFNALLKTLEEPPQHVIFIFATTEVQKIPVTILSRCQRFDFRRIPVKKIAESLKSIANSEGVEIDSQALWLLAREAEGSMRDSQSLLDQVITFCGKKITYAQVIDVLGLTDRTILSQTLEALINRDVSRCLEIIEKVFHVGYDTKQFAQDLLEHLRNLMIVKVGGDRFSGDFLDLPEQEIDELKKFSKQLSEEDIHLLFDMTIKGVGDILRAQDPRIVLEMLLLRLSQAPRLTSIERLASQVSGGSASNPVPSTPVPKTSPPNGGDHLSRWSGLVENIKKEKPLLGAKLDYAVVEKIEDGKLSIAFKKEQEFFYSQVSQKDVVSQLVELVNKYWGKPHHIEVNLASASSMTPSLKEQNDSARESREQALRKKVESHPIIRDVRNIMQGKITSIKETP